MTTENSVKSKKSSPKWRRIRQAVQIIALLLFLYLLLGTQQGNTSFLPHDLFFRINPLAGISAMLTSRSWIAPMAWGLATLLLTIVLGRVWCSWVCPLGTLLDWTPSRRPKRSNPDIPSYWRQVKYFLLFTILIAAIMGSLTLLILDPITLLFRAIASTILPALSVIITTVETWLYNIGPLQPAVEWFDNLVRGSLITGQPIFLPNLLVALLLAAVLALNAIRPRFWCRYLCPLGGLLGLVSRAAQIRYRVDGEKCISCQLCATGCPTGAIDPERNFAAASAECTTCLDCMETCPTGAISFSKQPGLAAHQRYDPSRRQFLTSLGAATIGAALLRFAPLISKKNPQFVRPPGTNDEKLLSECIRCGECVKVCPTGGLQPCPSLNTWEALWTPILISRLGYCDYSCNACGQVCPTEAIPNLPLVEKQKEVIGKAFINRNLCIPWADGLDCIVCEEVCPIPNKAIRLEERVIVNSRGETTTVHLPRVRKGTCNGCGICEYLCPVDGEAAIRVYPIG